MTSLERHIERLVEDQLSEVRAEVEQLSEDVEEIENFATISLGERRLNQNEANLAEFSASLTEFSEQTLEKVNDLESQLELQTIVLASILESLADADLEVDVSEIRDYQQEQLVTEQSASGNLEAAIDAVES
ncbi:hypothetical protein [Halosolutus halophilus]|uniref:hypothetical protein n=1 Tax=Halosolutus halophilus TaxID=1552990 RepID=UPI002234ECB2|nr:hypothetical protein [Halosolutus halophilus]